jgi:hypothetical protein
MKCKGDKNKGEKYGKWRLIKNSDKKGKRW